MSDYPFDSDERQRPQRKHQDLDDALFVRLWLQGNFNIDTLTNFADFVVLANNFGSMVPAPASATIPEPAVLSLLVGAVVALRLRRQKLR